MYFVLTLHSHLPYLLNHGRWPHGSDWLCEAALDTYLPLLETLQSLQRESVSAPVTLGITPVLGNQLASPVFKDEMEAFFRLRIGACREANASLPETGDGHLRHLAEFWEKRFLRYRDLFRSIEGDLLTAFRRLEEAGRIETISSAATHGFLPLLGREESIRLQLSVGYREHRRLFGRAPRGCWVPECAYRGSGEWDPIPGLSRAAQRRGIESFLEEAGFRYFFLDTHMAEAGESLGTYGDVPHGVERFDGRWEAEVEVHGGATVRSAHEAYQVSPTPEGVGAAAFVREPRSSMQVWSRHHGYPGEASYLEFHKIRWPGGIRFWRVTGPDTDLGDKEPYDPSRARERVHDHASHYARTLQEIGDRQGLAPGSVTMAPFDTELFGHWWFEGVDFLGEVYRRLQDQGTVKVSTASGYLDRSQPRQRIRPLEGSWGANGDFSMWMNQGTRWTWERLWPLEDAFWKAAPVALASTRTRPILAQAARQLLLAQSSDWQFMISTGAVPDYGAERFLRHCEDAGALLEALRAADGRKLDGASERAGELAKRDDLFPDILDSVEEALARSAGSSSSPGGA
jgi:1,4-alpha-glucan branching enzyme